jgi:uncharacterized protein YuzE
MKITIGNWASYIDVKEWDDSFQPLTTKEIANNVYLDYSKDGELIGIEILGDLELEYYSDYEKRDK